MIPTPFDPKRKHILLSQLLETEGYFVVEAESGNSALAILRAQLIDLVISDIQMSDGDGFSLLTEIKRTFQNPPPLIFVSAHLGVTEESVKELGAIGLL